MKVENTWNSITWSNRFSVITSRRGNKNNTSLVVIHSLYCPLRKIYKSLAVNICVMIQQSKIYIFRRRWSLDGYEIKYFWLIVYNLLLNALLYGLAAYLWLASWFTFFQQTSKFSRRLSQIIGIALVTFRNMDLRGIVYKHI